jgi:hypothetical protein
MAETVEFYAGFASPIQVHFAALNDLESVPVAAGWYAWFYIPSAVDEASLDLYRHSKVNSTVTGIFNLTYEGRLKPTGNKLSAAFNAASDPESLDTLKSLFLAFAPPLYIGIAKCLRSRLKSHRKNLRDFMSSGDAEATESAAISGIEPDSEHESQYFGARIGAALRALTLSPDTLYVKCVVADDPAKLKQIEKILNFALTPHYGRK